MRVSRHSAAKHFHALGLFSNLDNFAELEKRIARIENSHQKGAAFEVFAEAWLTTQRIPQAREVWPGNSPPQKIQETLRLPLKDMGVDGIVETATDELLCYQVKFRANRPALTWAELSTFFGLADSGNGRLVFTNCDDIAEVAEQRPGSLFIRGSDLDRMTADDFRIIEAWISGSAITRVRKTPLPHQAEAIDNILAGLAQHSRATALMACGTGKTLVSLWIAERLKVRTVLILLPSLALVRQTLHEWMHETSWPEHGFQYLCVCSDPSVQPEEDAFVVRPSEVDFRVTTKSADVRRFLERPTDSIRLVFSTYQSSEEVAKGVAGLPMFDLRIFDEAHKTASRTGTRFGLALDDAKLPIARRLFLTATPRHYKIDSKDKQGNAKVVFSMDVPEVYGPVVHRLPFSTAAKLKIITDYKIAITIVTSTMVTNELLRRSVVLVRGQEIKAPQVANQIALQSAIQKYNVRKIFTFHSKVATAQSFTSNGPEGIASQLPLFHCGHINGEMPTAQRERRMKEFEAAPCAILSNARCLTEGVDVPAVDMVAFLSPRRSLVDIVQAAGRAMRRSPGKTVGYVLVPLYVEQARGETVEEAVTRTDFREVWKVLNQLQEHDDLLAQTIAEMRIERGKTGGFDDARFREKVEILPPEISIESLRKAISAACLDAIGDNWFERYGQLVSYYEKNGTCEMPRRLADNKTLATWVINQRVLRKENTLSNEKIALLNKLCFNWSPKAHTWRSNYLELIAYKEKHGDCRVPQDWVGNKLLAKWVSTQRTRKRRNQLSQNRVQMLERIGFAWFVGGAEWEYRFEELVNYGKLYGNLRVPALWKENRKLASWVVHQRYKKKKGMLSLERERLLTEINFDWNLMSVSGERWKRMFQLLTNFHETHGHCNVTRSDNAALAAWVTEQRSASRKKILAEEEATKLDSLGFTWLKEPKSDGQWAKMFEHLSDYKSLHGNTNVPSGFSDKRLAGWVSKQRTWYRVGSISSERIEKLESLGFRWKQNKKERSLPQTSLKQSKIKSWEDYFSELGDYFKNFGDCDVPNGWPNNIPLARWVTRQRELRRKEKLLPDQERRLSSLGFSWEIFTASWESMFAKLKQQLELAHEDITPRFSNELKRWMLTQRQFKKRGELVSEREAKLNSIGFEWKPFVAQWEQMREKLQKYYLQNGHSNVPQNFSLNPQLGRWVATQRRNWSKKKLSEFQVQSLGKVDFAWSLINQTHPRTAKIGRPKSTEKVKLLKKTRLPDDQEWQSMYQMVLEYKQAYGDCLVPQRWKQSRRLADWVSKQRTAYHRKQLSEEYVQRLEDLGFEWDPLGTHWGNWFQQLVEFRNDHGHTNVPQRAGKYKGLGVWVHNQRMAKRLNRPIMADREKRLDEIGFVWRLIEPNSWESMFEQLAEFKKTHGHCNVPQQRAAHKKLGKWVNSQRTAFKRGKLSTERQAQLQRLGFVWNTKMNNFSPQPPLL